MSEQVPGGAVAGGPAHFILYVADQAVSARFYAQVLDQAPRLDVPGMTEFCLGGSAVLGLMPLEGARRLLGAHAGRVADRGVRAELYLHTPDVATAHQRALAAGAVEVSAPARRDWGDVVAYSLDPDGHVLAFACRPEGPGSGTVSA